MPQSVWDLFPFRVAPHRSPGLVENVGFWSALQTFTTPGWPAMHYHHDTITDLPSHPDPPTLTQRVLPIPQRISTHLTHCSSSRQPLACCSSWTVCMHPSHRSTCTTSPSCRSYASNSEVLWLHTRLWFLQFDQYTLGTNFLLKSSLQFTTHDFSIGFRYNSPIKALGFVAGQCSRGRYHWDCSSQCLSRKATSKVQSSHSKKEPWQGGDFKVTVHLFAILASIWAVVFSVSLGGIKKLSMQMETRIWSLLIYEIWVIINNAHFPLVS